MPTASELAIVNTADAFTLADNIFGNGVSVLSATLTGDVAQSGTYTGGDATLGDIAPADAGIILSTGNVADFTNSSGDANTTDNTSTDFSGAGYADLDAITGQTTQDAVVLAIEFEALGEFTAAGRFITMQFTFSSEEYLEYVNSGVNDAFGVWVNDLYVPFTPANNDLVSIDTINDQSSSNLYLNNVEGDDTYNTEMDGSTITLSIKAPLIEGTNTMVIALADGGDGIYDTNVLIAGNSVQSIALAFEDTIEMEPNTQITVDVLANDIDTTGSGLTITEINGNLINPGESILLPTGETVTLNADGTVTIENDGDIGSESFTYTVINGAGNTDVGFIIINTVADVAPNYIVEGTFGDDIIYSSYTGDAQGDLIDNLDHSDASNDDSVIAGAGNDIITSGLGDDTIDAGIGNDTVFGGDGNDTVFGGAGDDDVYGGIGDDQIILYNDFGNDTIDGGTDAGDADVDVLDGSNLTQNVTLDLTAPETGTIANGTDTATFSEIEKFILGSGDDSVTGSTGDDIVDLGQGADTINAGAGNDQIDLGEDSPGNPDQDLDVVVLEDDFGDDIVTNFDAPTANLDGTFTGIDMLDVTGLFDAPLADPARMPVNTNDVVVTGGADAILTFPNGETITLVGISASDADNPFFLNAIGIPMPEDGIVTGTQGDDLIDGSYAGDLEGDFVDNTDALISGEAPNDDIIVAQGGDDSVLAGLGDDDIYGGDGSDTIDAGAGNDTVYGDTPDGAWSFEYFDLDPTGAPQTLAQAGFIPGTPDFDGTPTSFGYTDSLTPGDFDNGDDYALKFSSTLVIGIAGDYTFRTGSDDGSKLFIDGVEVVNNDGHHGLIFVDGTPVTLAAGEHTIDVIYFENNGGNQLQAFITGPDTLDVQTNLAGYDGLRVATGDDVIAGGAGDDTLFGGTGDDRFYVAEADDTDVITGGEDLGDADIDTVDFSNVAGGDGVTITYDGDESADYQVGATGSDGTFDEIEALVGTDNADVIDATLDTAGITADTGAGADTVTGGEGDDDITAGAGDDTIRLNNDFGNDTIDGGTDAGDADVDVLDGSNLTQNVTLDLTAPETGTITNGTDTATFSEIEEIILGSGDDSVTGSIGDDIVDLGQGADTINAGAGNDQIDLGEDSPGNPDQDPDVVVLEDGFGDNVITNFDAPTPDGDGTFTGIDTLDVTNLFDAPLGDPTRTAVNTNDVVVTGGADTILTFPNGETITLVGVPASDADNPFFLNAIGIPLPDGTVSGGADGDVIDGSYLGDPDGDMVDNNDAILAGDTGNDDLIEANGGGDTVFAGDGNDEVYGGTGDDTIDGGVGNDTLFGDTGSDIFTIAEADGTDVITGGEDVGGDDVDTFDFTGVTGGDGIDVTFNADEAGSFQVGASGSDGTFTQIEALIASNYADTIDLSGDTTGISVDAGAGDDVITGGTGSDEIDAGAGQDNVLIGDNFGNDTIDGGAVADGTGDVLDGSALTQDVTVNFTAPETGTVSNGTDTATFSEIEDIITGSGDDTIIGGTGDDVVSTGAGVDTITGGAGNDTFDAGSGDDTINGGVGDDSIAGGLGSDTIAITDDFGNDTIDAGEDVGDGDVDVLEGSGLTDGVTVTLTGNEVGTVSDGIDTLSFGNVEEIITGSGDDTIIGGTGEDSVSTGAGNDVISGGEGADTFDAGAGDDVITFAEGDSIDGGAGDDTFILEDLLETSTGTINIDGGDEDTQPDGVGPTLGTGDVLQLGDLADLSTLVQTPNGDGGFDGSVTLDDGTILTFTDIESVICFTPGTNIATPSGSRAIETLQVGDIVVTRDHGLQPIRWIQQRTVPATDRFAPVRLRPGVVTGLERDLLVSPQHRMLFQGYRAELLFGESEVLMPATHLIDGKSVTREEGGFVTYIHMMFDQHEVIYAEGAASESFHPGEIGLTGVTDAARDELFSLFPALRSDPKHYGRTARRTLKKHESQMLRTK